MRKEGLFFDYILHFAGKIVPAKNLSYKRDPHTNVIIEVIKPRTHDFERDLAMSVAREIGSNKKFPTKKEILICIEHDFHSEYEYATCDLDNRAKTILDALKGVVYGDDAQVCVLWTRKKFLPRGQHSYFQISISILTHVRQRLVEGMMDNLR